MVDPGAQEAFRSVAALRDSNRVLLDELADREGAPPSEFLDRIERFRQQAAATGTYISAVEERAEAQSIVNFWLTVLFNNGRATESLLLADFNFEAALGRSGDVAPYKGLEPFGVEDSGYFFGRHKAISDMLAVLAESRLLAVTGLSGSGKSSVVRAGLIPRLREGAIAGSSEWLVPDPIVPGRSPIAALTAFTALLARGLGPIECPADLTAALDGAGRPVLLSVDQFEELFTVTESEEDRQLFLDALVHAATQGAYPHIVLITMRSEYDAWVEKHTAFAELFNAGRVSIAALSARDLRTAIEQPAYQIGVRFESGLAESLVQAAVGEPAGLPLLQFALLELWKNRSGDVITLEAYRSLGGSPRAILATRAAAIYDNFLPEDQELSRGIFLALVKIGEGLQPTSRRVLRSQLKGPRDNVDRVLSVWRDNGLIRIAPRGRITSASEIEVAHEALIRNWDLLIKWVREENAGVLQRGLLTEKAHAWLGARDRRDLLLGELSLNEADRRADLTPEEQLYVEASRAEVRHQRRSLYWRVFAATALSLLLIGFGAFQSYRASARSEEAREYERKANQNAADLTKSAERFSRRSRQLSYAARVEVAKARSDEKTARLELARLASQRQAMLDEYAQLSRTKSATAGDLQAMKGRMQEMQGQVTILERAAFEKVRAAETALYSAKLELEKVSLIRAVNEQAARTFFSESERPALRLAGGKLTDFPDYWKTLGSDRAVAEQVARSVGRLQIPSLNMEYVGTAFLVAEDVVAAVSFQLPEDRNLEGATIDFSDAPNADKSRTFRILGLVGEIPLDQTVALLRVERINQAGQPLPPPVRLAVFGQGTGRRSAEGGQGAPTYSSTTLFVIGYPKHDPRQPDPVNQIVLGTDDGTKRVQPGLLLKAAPSGRGVQLAYDSTTFGGNGGSPVVDARTGRVIGIHHSGRFKVGRWGSAFTEAFFNAAAARSAGLRPAR